jgi:hypothetical protein
MTGTHHFHLAIRIQHLFNIAWLTHIVCGRLRSPAGFSLFDCDSLVGQIKQHPPHVKTAMETMQRPIQCHSVLETAWYRFNVDDSFPRYPVRFSAFSLRFPLLVAA